MRTMLGKSVNGRKAIKFSNYLIFTLRYELKFRNLIINIIYSQNNDF